MNLKIKKILALLLNIKFFLCHLLVKVKIKNKYKLIIKYIILINLPLMY